ncbi:glycosyltransferase family 25 protein [Nocardioides sp.]|uniref:glycosyltransferase family 25 protein n=1 Tax=Nocardioides sp. TaxID=35761 RepID=UPI003514F322
MTGEQQAGPTAAPFTVRVLGLRRSWRGAEVCAHLQRAGLRVSRVEGVDLLDPAVRFDGRPPADWVDVRGCRLVVRRTLTDGEVGCALAHLRAQREAAVRGEDWSVVLEDDVTPPQVEDLTTLVGWCRTRVPDDEPTVVLLYARGAIVVPEPVAALGHATVWATVVPPDCALGYVLNRAAAELLVGATLPLIGPSDWPPRVAGRMRFLVADPPLVRPREVASTIGDRPGDSWPRWSRPLRRLLLVTGLLWPWYRRRMSFTAYRTLEWDRTVVRRRLGSGWSATSTRPTTSPPPLVPWRRGGGHRS